MEKNELVDVAEFDPFTLFIKKRMEYITNNKIKVIAVAVFFLAALIVASFVPMWLEKKQSSSFVELQHSLRASAEKEVLTKAEIFKIFQPVKEKYKNSKAAGFADLYIARNLYKIGNLKEAADFYLSSEKILSGYDMLSEIIDYELGCLYFDSEPSKSKPYFEKLVSSESFLQEDGLFYLALAGDEKSLEKSAEKFPGGFYSELINEKILIKNKKN